MNLTRRSFIGTILAAAVAPAIVRADSLMRMVSRETLVVPVRRAVSVMSFGHIDAHAYYIDVTSFTDTAKRTIGTLRYIATDIELLLPDYSGSEVLAVYADGRKLDLAALRDVRIDVDPTGLSKFHLGSLDLADFGCRIPNFEIEVR